MRSIQRTVCTLDYDKNTATLNKSEAAFRIQFNAWRNHIIQENLKSEPHNINTLLREVATATYTILERAYWAEKFKQAQKEGAGHGL